MSHDDKYRWNERALRWERYERTGHRRGRWVVSDYLSGKSWSEGFAMLSEEPVGELEVSP